MSTPFSKRSMPLLKLSPSPFSINALIRVRQPHKTPVVRSTNDASADGRGQDANFLHTAVAIALDSPGRELSATDTSFCSTSKNSAVTSDDTSTRSIAWISHGMACSDRIGVESMRSWAFFLTLVAAVMDDAWRAESEVPSQSNRVIMNLSAIPLDSETKLCAVLVDLKRSRRNFNTSDIVDVEIPLSPTTMAARLLRRPSASDKDCSSLLPASSNWPGWLVGSTSGACPPNKQHFKILNATALPILFMPWLISRCCSGEEKNLTTPSKPPDSMKSRRKEAARFIVSLSRTRRCSTGKQDKVSTAGCSKASIARST
mmetsp:Transcript_43869/g.105843  ORF Transcript_43869/g.105843 Transcript_43869/m.105843 type:complete len:316 (-) Transcript_43869:3878-4825(-)